MGTRTYDDLPVGVLIADDAIVIRTASASFLRDFSCLAEDVQDRELSELISPRDRRASMLIDRASTQAATEPVDTIAVVEVGEVARLARIVLVRESQQWMVLVECIDNPQNLVLQLFSEHRRWSAALRGSSDGLVFVDEALTITDYNARFVELMQFRSDHGVLLGEELLPGRELATLLAPAAFEPMRVRLDAMWSREGCSDEFMLHGRWLELDARPIYLPSKGLSGHAISLRDATDRHDMEHARAERQRELLRHSEEVIAAQRQAIRALTAPRIPIARGLTVVPLVGALDTQRLSEIVEDLLEGVARDGTRTLVLDITGVPEFDGAAAAGLLSAARSLRLIGVHPILTGVSPRTAQLLASEHVPTHGLEIHGSLEAAIASSMRRSSARPVTS
ncbi:STAS domain-containing protein [Enhygromyxa salina]|uniref:RsbT co-antagonist protein RsbRA n=1 Tax=Enhygromyxa salina TaxID=215803 RepID=A0A2S9YLJ1_9BACT|nr:STAS domain-containing protein [Enhygromyxa salina]PRQ05981.1 RsbT co-antagonist protein RsbRA [Enhygromyxa salina]